MNLKIYLYLLAIPIIFSGCIGSKKIDPTTNIDPTPPSWYLSPPNNNSTYLYGLGEASDIRQAQTSALENLSQRLLVEISSSSEYKLESYTDFREYTNKSSKQNIKSEFKSFTIPSYEIVDTKHLANDHYVVLVSVEKIKIINTLKDEIDTLYNQVSFSKKNIDTKNILTRRYFLEDTMKLLQESNDKLVVLKNLEPSFNIKKYLSVQQTLSNELETIKSTTTISIETDNDSKQFSDIVESFLVKNGFILYKNSRNDPHHIVLNLNSNIIENNTYGIDIIKVVLTLKAICQGQYIGGNIINFKAGSSNSKQDAKQNLTKQLQKILNNKDSKILFRDNFN